MKKKVVAKKGDKKVTSPVSTPKPKKSKLIVSGTPVVYTSVRQALFAFQGEQITLPRTGNGKSQKGTDYKYVTLDVLIERVIPILQKYRLGFAQVVQGDKLVTELFHADSDTSIISEIPLGKPDNIQDLGGRITYLKRYALTALLGLSAEEDIDASGSTGLMGANIGAAPISPVVKAPDALAKPVQPAATDKKDEPEMNGMGARLARGEKPLADTSFIKPATAENKEEAPEFANFNRRLEELTASSEWFAKARNAIESCKTLEAVLFLEPQIATSKKATDEEKVFGAALLKTVAEKLTA